MSRSLSDPPAGPQPPSPLPVLLEKIGAGSESAMASFYDATHRWVYAVVLRLLTDRHVAEETTLDVYLQVWRDAKKYLSERGTVEAWLFRIARSRAIDRLRSGAKRRTKETSFAQAFDTAADVASPDEQSASKERRARVAAAVAKLPQSQRRVIELAYFEGLSHREIAARVKEPLGTIKTQIRLGMTKLKNTLVPWEASL